MRIIVTHLSPDIDAITSVWVIKKFLPGWSDAKVEFVPAGKKLERVKNHPDIETKPIIESGNDEIMHVDTGFTPLDHHQTSSMDTSGAKRAWDFVLSEYEKSGQVMKPEHIESVSRIIDQVVAIDHFQEVYRPEPDADYQDFSLWGINEGLQYLKPGEDDYFIKFGRTCLDYLYSYFENKIWAEAELEKGIEFEIKAGKCLGIESQNDSVIKLAQKRGYVLVVRKDPRRGNVAIKTMPLRASQVQGAEVQGSGIQKGIDLTLAYEQLKKMDPDATWFLHVSKKMLLNGSVKNPDMKPTKLTLGEVINVLKSIY